MNKQRRKSIADVQTKLANLKMLAEEIMADIETIKDEETEYYDNMPESFQNGEKGEVAQEAVDNLETAFDAMQTLCDEIDEVDSNLEDSAQ